MFFFSFPKIKKNIFFINLLLFLEQASVCITHIERNVVIAGLQVGPIKHSHVPHFLIDPALDILLLNASYVTFTD